MFNLVRVIARLKGVSEEDYAGEPGSRFLKYLRRISEFCRARGVGATDLADLGAAAVMGAATEKQAKASRDFAEAEQKHVQTAAMLRSADAAARKDEADATLSEINTVSALVDLTEKLNKSGLAALIDSEGRLQIVKAPPGFTIPATDLATGVFIGEEVTQGVLANVILHASASDVLHLAGHGEVIDPDMADLLARVKASGPLVTDIPVEPIQNPET